MSGAEALLAKCRERGIVLRPGEGGKLKVSPPPERLPSELVEELRLCKQQLLTLLTTEAPAPRQEPSPHYRALYAEMTQAIPEDFPLVDAWLVDAHPALWQRIRDLDDALLHMERERAPEATYAAKLAELVAVCQQAKDLKEGTWRELPIRSTVLGGEEVWVVRDETQAEVVMSDGKAVYYADEFEVLKSKAPEQLRDVHKVKLVFPGSKVTQ